MYNGKKLVRLITWKPDTDTMWIFVAGKSRLLTRLADARLRLRAFS